MCKVDGWVRKVVTVSCGRGADAGNVYYVDVVHGCGQSPCPRWLLLGDDVVALVYSGVRHVQTDSGSKAYFDLR